MPPRVLQGSRPSSRSARGGPSLASHHTHALLFVGHACSRSARWPSLPQSSLYSPLSRYAPGPAVVAREIARSFSQGFGAPCLRAPGLRRPFAPSRPLLPLYSGTWAALVRLKAHQRSPAHAPRGRASNAVASTSCIDPTHRQGIAPSLLGLLAAPRSPPLAGLRRGGGRRIARTGPSLVAPIKIGAPATGPPVPRRAGAEIRPHTKPALSGAEGPLEEAHAPSTRPWPVECTGQPTQPSNTRPSRHTPGVPHVAVPHGSLMRCDPKGQRIQEAACRPIESNAPGSSDQPAVQAASAALRSTVQL